MVVSVFVLYFCNVVMYSGIASLHRLVRHNLGLPIWIDSRGTMGLCVHYKHTILLLAHTHQHFMYSVSIYLFNFKISLSAL